MSSQVAADAWTTGTLVLIGIGMVLTLVVIWWGARLKRRRASTEAAIEDRAEDAQDPAPLVSSLDDATPSAPETDPVPVAPAPPPLADTPVVATPPVEAVAVAVEPAVEPVAPAPLSAQADDLTRMKGVGPKLAVRLGELGVTRFAQIAALGPNEASALDVQLGAFQGRIARDRWVEQAGYLANDDRAGFEAAFGKL